LDVSYTIFPKITPVYETSNVLERTVVVLNDIHIDIMDYISPAVCTDAAFRTMWAEFEWENKVPLAFPLTYLFL
jgi:vesicle coat complex subunit